jgi:hypothetical protein
MNDGHKGWHRLKRWLGWRMSTLLSLPGFLVGRVCLLLGACSAVGYCQRLPVAPQHTHVSHVPRIPFGSSCKHAM